MQNAARYQQRRKPPPPLSSAGGAVTLEYLTDVEHCETTVMKGNNALYLPPDIIVNILKRLPVKSLIRFQCMCKDWKNLLKYPLFIADHVHHSSHRPSLLLQRSKFENKQLHICSLDCDFRLHEVDHAPLIDSLSCINIIGSSNGLVCLTLHMLCDELYRNPLLLWNPATREDRLVPRTIDFMVDCYFGFRFSPIASDYKIVRIYGYKYYHENRNLIRDLIFIHVEEP